MPTATAFDVPPVRRRVRGWHDTWAPLAGCWRRIAARAVDVAVLAAVGSVVVGAGWLLHLPLLAGATAALLPVLMYEPFAATRGGTLGKRLMAIQPINVHDGRRLRGGAAVRRAVLATMACLFWPLGVYNLAWLLADPARQCFHDRQADAIVVNGWSRSNQKR